MAGALRERTRRTWWIVIILAAAAVAVVVWWLSTRQDADIGGTIAMESAQPPAERPLQVPNP